MRARRGGGLPEPAEGDRSIGPVTLHDELARVRALTERLPESSRRVLLGRMEGRTYEELATESGEPVDTIRKRYLSGLKELRHRLGACDEDVARPRRVRLRARFPLEEGGWPLP